MNDDENDELEQEMDELVATLREAARKFRHDVEEASKNIELSDLPFGSVVSAIQRIDEDDSKLAWLLLAQHCLSAIEPGGHRGMLLAFRANLIKVWDEIVEETLGPEVN